MGICDSVVSDGGMSFFCHLYDCQAVAQKMRLLGVSFTMSLSSSRHLWSIRVYAQNIADRERVSIEVCIYSVLLLLNQISFLFFIWQFWLWMAKCAAPLQLPVCLCAEEQHKDTLWRRLNLKVKVDCKLLLLTLLLGLTERVTHKSRWIFFFFPTEDVQLYL